MIRALLLIVAIGWMAFIGMRAMESWPALPLDVGRDPQVVALHEREVQRHVLRHSLIGVGPPIVLIALVSFVGRRKRTAY